MAGGDDVRRIALGLPETTEGTSHGQASWSEEFVSLDEILEEAF